MYHFIVICNNNNLNQKDNTLNNVIIGPVNINSPHILLKYTLFVNSYVSLSSNDYIKRADRSSAIANLHLKNNIVFHLIVTRLTQDDEYIYFRYFKDSNYKGSKLGTRIYNGNKGFIDKLCPNQRTNCQWLIFNMVFAKNTVR
ncbi:hypothetical protein U3516DRAFT_765983 [Neocallimastix sp. 'constans']